MTISEEINAIRDKYAPKLDKLKPSHYCRNTYAYSLGECAKCGMCGREFDENGAITKDANVETYGWEGK